MSAGRRVRCAIYTRKSSEEGLEQDFNSLDAQREACAAYIKSQASEGWHETPERYDDGGLSGGTLERPALQRLLADVAGGRIDIIVVYKVDRLTRSLLDFAKLVEALDKADTSFVSVTQSFNTTTSMGRLTLNMLLSFAQFEREVTAERIRDKIAASKARGMWMGGVPPLGYKPNGRSLAIVEEHAQIIRHIFDRYLALGNVRLLADDLKDDGIAIPVRATAGGKPLGGGWFSRGLLHVMLRRVTYDGQIAHLDKVYVGNHPAIVDRATFERVQAMLADHAQSDHPRIRTPKPSLFAGRIVDEKGEPLTPTHATKGKVRYRYYVSRGLHQKISDTGVRIPAREIERLVTTRLAAFLDDPIEVVAAAWLDVPANRLEQLHCRLVDLAAQVRSMQPVAVQALIEHVRVTGSGIAVQVTTAGIAELLDVAPSPDAPPSITLTADALLTRSGRAMRMVLADRAIAGAAPDRSLVKQLITARRWWDELRKGQIDITRLSAREGVTASYMTRIVRLAFVSPQVVQASLAGRLRNGVDTKLLRERSSVAASWSVQKAALLPSA